MTTMHLFAFDTETFLIGPGAIAPKMVCMTVAYRDASGQIAQAIEGNDPESLARIEATMRSVLTNPAVKIVGHNLAYDMGVLMHALPQLGTLIWDAYEAGRCYCTIQAEKLRNVSKSGAIEFVTGPNGEQSPAKYHLDNLGQKYLGKTRTADKADPDGWRLRYALLDGKPAAEYPAEAKRYALEDAYDTLLIAERQIEGGTKTPGYDSVETTEIRSYMDFAYFLVTVRGIRVDPERAQKLSDAAEAIAHWTKLPLLVENKYLTPPTPPRPYARGAKNPDGTPKMTKGEDEAFAASKFRVYVLDLCLEHNIDIKLTDTGRASKLLGRQEYLSAEKAKAWIETYAIPAEEKQPSVNMLLECGGSPAKAYLAQYVCTDAEVAKTLAGATKNPMLHEFALRKSVEKLRTTILPNVLGHTIVYPKFDLPKETMRASSRVEKKLYPSAPVHGIPKDLHGLEPRTIFIPRDGYVFIDADYTALELCTAAQKTWELFRGTGVRCVLRDTINAGIDPHGFFGAELAYLNNHPEIVPLYNKAGAFDNASRYEVFRAMKKDPSAELRAIFRHQRNYAKPNTLGFWGGLGKVTMVQFAANNYDIYMTVDEAARNKQAWFNWLPEARPFFTWAETQIDTHNPVLGQWEDGRPIKGFAYKTPLGTTRRGCLYTVFCNGVTMQSPAGDGFNLAMTMIQRECYDPSLGSVLLGSGVVIPLHDQVILETPLHWDDAHPQGMARVRAAAKRLEALLVAAMARVCPDVVFRAEPHITSVWSKNSEPTFDANGEMIPWTLAA